MKLNDVDAKKLVDKISSSFDELKDLFIRKNSDYGCSIFSTDPLCSFVCPMTAIRVRMNDKINRLSSLFNKSEAAKVSESVSDTLKDLAVYAIILANMYDTPERTTTYAQDIATCIAKHTDCASLMEAKDIEDMCKAKNGRLNIDIADYEPKASKELEDIKISDGIVEKYNS